MKIRLWPTLDFTTFEPPLMHRSFSDCSRFSDSIASPCGVSGVRARVAAEIQIASRFDEGCKIEIPRHDFSTRGGAEAAAAAATATKARAAAAATEVRVKVREG